MTIKKRSRRNRKLGESGKSVSAVRDSGATGARERKNSGQLSRETSQSARRLLPIWKKALFSVVVTLALLSLLEGFMAVLGVRPVLYEGDPYVGFTSRIPLFVEEIDQSGVKTMVTAKNKLRFFNAQAFPAKKPANTCRIFCMGGSTTYGRPYDDTTSFCGWLREFLPKSDPSKNWELINAGGISYASYRVATLTEELIQYEPDLFIVYCGQNEFLERRTYQHLIQTPSAVRELGALVSGTRTYAAVHRVCSAISGPSKHSVAASAMLDAEVNTILGESIGPKDYHRDRDFQQQAFDHYRFNVMRIADIAQSVGAEVVFVTPASNLLDCSPFKSEHKANLADAERRRWDELYEESQEATTAGQWNDVVALLDKAATIDNRYAHLHYLRGRALYKLGRYKESEESLIRGRDEDVCPLRALGPMRDIVTRAAADRDARVVDFTALVEERSPHGIPGENLFLDHVHPTIEGNRMLAVALLNEMIRAKQVDPVAGWGDEAIQEVAADVESRLDRRAHATALRNLSKVLAWSGKYEEARKLVEKAATIIPDDAVLHFQLGVCDQGEGDFAKAAEHFRQAIQIEPNYAEAHNNLGFALEQQGSTREAMDCFTQAIRINGDDDKALFNMGKALLKQGHFQLAVEHLKRVVELRPLDAEAHTALASALVRQGKSSDALELLKKAVELQPNDPDAHNKLGSLQAAHGEYMSAASSYRRAIEIDGSHVGAMENLAWLLATAKDARCRNGAEAVRLAKEACEGSPYEDPAALEVLAAAHAEVGDFQQATDTAQRAAILATQSGHAGLSVAIRQRLELYNRDQPFRE